MNCVELDEVYLRVLRASVVQSRRREAPAYHGGTENTEVKDRYYPLPEPITNNTEHITNNIASNGQINFNQVL